MEKFVVYVLQNPVGKRYIGRTSDLERRIAQHNDVNNTLTRTTKRFSGPWRIVYSEDCADRTAALAREKALKSGQGELG